MKASAAALRYWGTAALLSAAVVFASVVAAATDYYVDATAGSDVNSGLTTALAWQTLAKVSATTLPAGATVYLKRGETWQETLTPGSSVTIDAYGSGALPTIDGSFVIAG